MKKKKWEAIFLGRDHAGRPCHACGLLHYIISPCIWNRTNSLLICDPQRILGRARQMEPTTQLYKVYTYHVIQTHLTSHYFLIVNPLFASYSNSTFSQLHVKSDAFTFTFKPYFISKFFISSLNCLNTAQGVYINPCKKFRSETRKPLYICFSSLLVHKSPMTLYAQF